MAEKTTFIKLDRNLLHWRWWGNHKTMTVWIWLIMNANIEDHDFEQDTIHRGELATSLKSIATNTNLTINEVRCALNHLKSTGEITSRIRPHYQVITILNYSQYQDKTTGTSTGKPQADHKQTTSRPQQSKNDKNDKKEKNIYSIPSHDEVAAYARAHGYQIDIDQFIAYNTARGWKMGGQRVDDWRSLVDLRAAQTKPADPEDDGLDVWGKPIKLED